MHPIEDIRDYLTDDEKKDFKALVPEADICENIVPLYGMPACRIGRSDFNDMGLKVCDRCPHNECQGMARWVPPPRFRES